MTSIQISQTCAQEYAKAISKPPNNNVYASNGCLQASASCVDCSSGVYNMVTQPNQEPKPPGVMFGATQSCGTVSQGICVLLGGKYSCSGLAPVKPTVNCYNADEYWNQPVGQ